MNRNKHMKVQSAKDKIEIVELTRITNRQERTGGHENN